MPNTTNFNFPTPADTDLVKDGASAIRSLGNSIDTAFVDLKGGTTGQILSKASNTDLDYTWITNDVGDITEVQAGTGISVASGTGPIPVVTNTVATTFDAKGDLVAGTGADTFAKLTVGANNTVLTADSSTATGLKWATPAGGGKVLQVVSATTSTGVFIGSSTYTDTGITATITPTLSTSKILILIAAHQGIYRTTAGVNIQGRSRILRDATVLFTNNKTPYFEGASASDLTLQYQASYVYLDSPATTSATTYKLQGNMTTGQDAIYQDSGNATSSIVLMEIGV